MSWYSVPVEPRFDRYIIVVRSGRDRQTTDCFRLCGLLFVVYLEGATDD